MARAYKRDSGGKFSGGGGGSSAPKGTIAKGGKGVSGSVARSVAATGGNTAPGKGMKPRLAVKAGAKQVMKEGRFAGSGGATYGNRSDRDSDKRWAKRETGKLNKEQKALESKLAKAKASAPSAKVTSAKAGLAAAQAKGKEAAAKLKASKARMAELKAQLAASQSRFGDLLAPKRKARR